MRTFLPFAVLLIAAVTLSAQTEEIDPSVLEGLKVLKGDGVGKLATSPSPLTHVSLGVVKGDIFGVANFKASFSVEPWSGSGNGSGGGCIRGSGPIVLTTRSGSVITMQQAGLSCDTGADPNILTDNGTYLIVEGTGRFSGATGTGNVVTGFKNGQVGIHFDGGIVLEEPKPDEDRRESDENKRD
jgi:hypothetical protein